MDVKKPEIPVIRSEYTEGFIAAIDQLKATGAKGGIAKLNGMAAEMIDKDIPTLSSSIVFQETKAILAKLNALLGEEK